MTFWIFTFLPFAFPFAFPALGSLVASRDAGQAAGRSPDCVAGGHEGPRPPQGGGLT